MAKMIMDPQEKPNPVQSNCALSLPFHAPPFFRQQHFKPSFAQLLKTTEDSSRLFRSSVVSLAQDCLKSLHFLSSQNPVIKRLLFLCKSHLQGFSQIRQDRVCKSVKALSTSHNFAAILPGDSVAGAVVTNGVLNFLNIYNSLLVVRLVLTWFPSVPPAIVTPLSTLCDPYLNIFRGLIPPLGGTLDLSPILAFLALNAFTSAASALPAELPTQKWTRRLTAGNRSRTGSGKN